MAFANRLRMAALPLHRRCLPTHKLTRHAHTLPATRLVGQPAAHSHPHLVSEGELTPGISAAEFATRRRALMSSLPENAAVVLSSAVESYIGHDIAVLFRQDPDLLYLTGFAEPECVVVLTKDEDENATRMSMLVAPRDAAKELWTGSRAGVDGAYAVFEADIADSIDDLATVLPELIRDCTAVYVGASGRHTDSSLTARVCDSVTATIPKSSTIHGLKARVQQLRVRKSDAELEVMRRAAKVTCHAHIAAMETAAIASASVAMGGRPLTETSICATLEHQFAMEGDGARPAYPCVVAGGTNANTLHYVSNSQVLREGDLVLVDAGAEVGHYASDITRTWPVSGVFSAAQRELYDVVFDCEERLIEELTKDVASAHAAHVSSSSVGVCSVGVGSTMSLLSLHARSIEILGESLTQLGFTGPVKQYYPHSVGHYLGMDVHDTPGLGVQETLVAGSVITLEPGLYLGADDTSVPERFRGIGIRIEDNVVIHADGSVEVLTRDAPKRAVDIEALMANAKNK